MPYGVDQFCPGAPSSALGRGRLLRAEILGREVVVFRGLDGTARALLDRCPHRGVALSLGAVCGEEIQCGYHGWKLNGQGRVLSVPGLDLGPSDEAPSTPAFAVREAGGLLWIFVGDPDRALTTPLPDLAPYGTRGSVDLCLTLDVPAHWSFVLDNGLDLFHQHLHRDVPFFFLVHELIAFGSDGARFTVRYRATLRNAANRRRPGEIALTLEGNQLTLDFDGFPIIRAVATPRSADGRRLTLWWLFSFPQGFAGRIALRAWMPVLRRQLLRGFRQDVAVLQSEQRAFDRDPSAPQLEVNPVIHAAHAHLARLISESALAAVAASPEEIRPEQMERALLIARAGRGELSVLAPHEGQFRLVDPSRLDEALPAAPSISLLRYQHFYVVRPDSGAHVIPETDRNPRPALVSRSSP